MVGGGAEEAPGGEIFLIALLAGSLLLLLSAQYTCCCCCYCILVWLLQKIQHGGRECQKRLKTFVRTLGCSLHLPSLKKLDVFIAIDEK